MNAMLLAELLGDRVENRFCMVQCLQKRIGSSYISSGKLTYAHAERHRLFVSFVSNVTSAILV